MKIFISYGGHLEVYALASFDNIEITPEGLNLTADGLGVPVFIPYNELNSFIIVK